MSRKSGFVHILLILFIVAVVVVIVALVKQGIFASDKPPIGSLDSVDNTNCGIKGWAVDPDNPDKPIQVQIYRDGLVGTGVKVAEITADSPDNYVNQVQGYSGNHGFKYSFDANSGFRDGKTHRVFVYGVNLAKNPATSPESLNTHLSGSPRDITCSLPPISASPNPCTIASGQSLCKTTVSWKVATGTTADICVSANGGADQLFATTGSNGSKDATWIAASATYTFKLRIPAGKCSGRIVGSVDVKAIGIKNAISAAPNPCVFEPGKTLCTSKISFSTDRASAEVCVSVGSGSSALFARFAGSTSKDAPWITSQIYNFTLREVSQNCSGSKLASVEVTGKKPPIKYFRYEMSDNPNEFFLVKMIEQSDIDIALRDLNDPTFKKIVLGIVKSGSGDFNKKSGGYWSWHLDPVTINFGDFATEVCDGRPSYVESTLSKWIGKTYCPWSAVVKAVGDSPPLPK